MKIHENKLIVVTGGAGFIGSCFVHHLNDLGLSNIVIVDDLGNGEKWRNLLGKRFAEVLHKDELFSWLDENESKVGAVVHLGACSKTVETDANYLLSNNYRYSQRLAQFAITRDIRFIYASSAATYGDGAQGFEDNQDNLDILRPLNVYGMSKHIFDQWLVSKGWLQKATGLKFFNVFGPNEYHKGRMASAITHVLPTAKKDGFVRLFQSNDPAHFCDGGQMRDFIYVKDVARMIYAFLSNDATGIYNIGSGVPTTWNELAAAIFKAVDLPTKIEYIVMPADLQGKYQNYTCADTTKVRGAIGEAAQCRPLEGAVIEYVRDYLLTGKTW